MNEQNEKQSILKEKEESIKSKWNIQSEKQINNSRMKRSSGKRGEEEKEEKSVGGWKERKEKRKKENGKELVRKE